MSVEIKLPSRKVPVQDRFDVIIIGGGLAGICAALAAARNGSRVLLAESLPYIGGNATIGLPLTTFRARNSAPLVVGGIPREIVEAVRALGGVTADLEQVNWIDIDCDLMQIVWTRLLDEAGVTLLCHAPLQEVIRDEKRITHAVFSGPDGLNAYEAGCFIDTSGDAVVAEKAGLNPVMGRERDGKTQPVTLTFDVAGIDVEQFAAAGGGSIICRRFEELREEMQWRNPREGKNLSFPTFIPGRPGVASFNVTRILVDKGTTSRNLTDAEREGRYQVEEFVFRFLKPHVPGFGNGYLSRIAHRVGVRETRRVRGEYELTVEDVSSGRKFKDAIACNSYPVDVHSPTGGESRYDLKALETGDYYTVPYRSLVAKGVDNLLVAGRCVSATHEGLGAVRVFGCVMPMGQAAGTAAALCSKQGCAARDLDTDLLRQTLRENGAIVG